MPLTKNPAYKRSLTAAFVKCVRQPGKYYDGLRSNGLLLSVSATGRKCWEARVRVGECPASRGVSVSLRPAFCGCCLQRSR